MWRSEEEDLWAERRDFELRVMVKSQCSQRIVLICRRVDT